MHTVPHDTFCKQAESGGGNTRSLSLDDCEKILNRNGNRYTREDVSIIRDFLYKLAEIDYETISHA